MVNFEDIESRAWGSSSLDGSINYTIDAKVPSSNLGTSLSNQYNSLTKTDIIPITLNISGSYEKPIYQFTSLKDILADVISPAGRFS